MQPGAYKVYYNFEGQVYVLGEEEGGRKKPFFTGFSPQCFFRTADIQTRVSLPEEKKMAVGGDTFTAGFKLMMPLPIYEGSRFSLREGGKTVGAGVVTKLLPDTEEDVKSDQDRSKKKSKGKK